MSFPDERAPYNDGNEIIPCTCTDECPHPCKGACGCEACSKHWSDELSLDLD